MAAQATVEPQAPAPWAPAPRRLRKRIGPGRIAFQAGNYTLMALYAAVCFIPLLHILAVSFSTGAAAAANLVGLWPVGFNTKAYEFVATRVEFLRSVGVSFLRLGAALPIYMVFNCITAYALSKREKLFPWRSAYLWFLFITMLFNGGLIPTFFVVLKMGLINPLLVASDPAAADAGVQHHPAAQLLPPRPGGAGGGGVHRRRRPPADPVAGSTCRSPRRRSPPSPCSCWCFTGTSGSSG